MVKFLGGPLEIPGAVMDLDAVRKVYVDDGFAALDERLADMEDTSRTLQTSFETTDVLAVPGQFVLADASAGAMTVTLPDNPAINARVAVKKIDTGLNVVSIVGAGGDLIDGDTSILLPRPQTAAHFVYDGADWRVSSVVVYDTGTIPIFTFRGDYDPAVGYVVNDVVYFQGSSYIARTPTTGVPPTVDASDANWALLALHGAKGDKGDVGATGGGSGGGSGFSQVVAVTGAFTAAAGDFVLANAAAGALTVTLAADPPVNTLIAVKKSDVSINAVTVVGSGGALIDGDPSCIVAVPQSGAAFIYDGTNWHIESTMTLEAATTFTYAGVYSGSTAYQAGDVVSYLGGSYVAVQNALGTAPVAGASSAVWGLIAKAGDPGPAGATGAKGDTGPAASVTVGTTTTGPAGSNATVTNSGTSGAAVLNFTIPRGADGASSQPAVGMLIASVAQFSTATSLPNGTPTVVGFDTVRGVQAAYATCTTGAAAKITVSLAGWYMVTGGIGFDNSATAGVRAVNITKNGSAVPGGYTVMPPVTTSAFYLNSPFRPLAVLLAAGDYLQVLAVQTSGSVMATASGSQYGSTLNLVYVGNF